MSPLQIEAVYERVPPALGGAGPAAVRWGLRASASRSERVPPPEQQPPPHRRQEAAARALPRPTARPQRGDRFEQGQPAAFANPALLGYTRAGTSIPLPLCCGGPAAGQHLDLRA
jgi:hypothetical protein